VADVPARREAGVVTHSDDPRRSTGRGAGRGAGRGRARALVAWLAFLTAAAAAIVQFVEGPPGSGYGWGSVVVSAVIVGVPLAAIGWAVRSGDRRYAGVTLVIAALMVALVLLALTGNWSGQTTLDRTLDTVVAVLVLVTCLGAYAEEIPLLQRPVPPARPGH
jgi:peptidoglycan/LPS O-acetylase OafA/YrhL